MNRNLLFLLFLVVLGITATAQENNFSTSAAIGGAVPILDNGIGVYLGANPSYSMSSRFSIEGQVSYLYARIDGSFLSGEEGSLSAFNTLLGGRLYLSPDLKTNRLFINALIGGNYTSEEQEMGNRRSQFGLGFSSGGFIELDQLIIGVSYDTPQYITAKVGYTF